MERKGRGLDRNLTIEGKLEGEKKGTGRRVAKWEGSSKGKHSIPPICGL